MENELPKRKRNRLDNYDYSSCGVYFITICTKDRKNIFLKNDQPNLVGEDIILPQEKIRLSSYGKIAEDTIKAIPEHYSHIELLQYVVMPNHIHMILLIPHHDGRMISSPTTISTVVGQTKRFISKQIGFSMWQRSFHDHVIHDRNDYGKISKYIYENPLKWQYDCFYTKNE